MRTPRYTARAERTCLVCLLLNWSHLPVCPAVCQVPVFIFELDRDEPVLIDQHYNARALEDLVMVVQNAANQYVAAHSCFLAQQPQMLQDPLLPCIINF